MSQTKTNSKTDSKKKYDGTTILAKEVLGDVNKLGKFIWNLWERLGGSEKEFEKQQVGAKLEIAAKVTLVALHQCTRRLMGIAAGTGNSTPQSHNKGLIRIVEVLSNAKTPIIDLGIVAMTAWKIGVYPSEDPKVTDDQAFAYMAKAAEALLETCGYNLDDLKDFEANRE